MMDSILSDTSVRKPIHDRLDVFSKTSDLILLMEWRFL